MLSRYTSSFHGFWQVGPARFWVRRTFCQSYRQHSGYTHGIFEQDSNSSLKQILPLWTPVIHTCYLLPWGRGGAPLSGQGRLSSSVWYVSEPEFLQLLWHEPIQFLSTSSALPDKSPEDRQRQICKFFGYCKPKLANAQLWYLLRPNLVKWSTISIRKQFTDGFCPYLLSVPCHRLDDGDHHIH